MFKGTERENQSMEALQGKKVAIRSWDRRRHVRFRHREAARKFHMDSIDVRVITTERRVGATLVDLNAEGAGILVTEPLPTDSPIGLELQIGLYTVPVFGQVRTVMQRSGRYRLGVRFVHIDAAERELLLLLEVPVSRA